MNTPWLPLWRTALQNNRGRFVQVATVSPDGLPEVRTVVLRGLTEAGEPYFHTDARSAKCRALAAGSKLELHAWWDGTREQFRLRCPAQLIGEGEGKWDGLRQKLWKDQGAEGRRLFLRGVPGAPLATPTEFVDSVEDRATPPEHFVLVLLSPTHVDYLKLDEPHERRIWRLEAGTWRGGAVIP